MIRRLFAIGSATLLIARGHREANSGGTSQVRLMPVTIPPMPDQKPKLKFECWRRNADEEYWKSGIRRFIALVALGALALEVPHWAIAHGMLR